MKIEREEVTEITVDMGMPASEIALEVEAGGEIYTGTVISMGNPHLVIFVDEMDQADLASVGPLLECLPLFPDRTNVEFVQVLKPDEVRMRVWERGSGITQACGTGACATAVAGVVRGKTKRKTKVIMDGGPLTIEWDERSGKVFMTGGAVNVFEIHQSLTRGTRQNNENNNIKTKELSMALINEHFLKLQNNYLSPTSRKR